MFPLYNYLFLSSRNICSTYYSKLAPQIFLFLDIFFVPYFFFLFLLFEKFSSTNYFIPRFVFFVP
jgi:hypothetical protein